MWRFRVSSEGSRKDHRDRGFKLLLNQTLLLIGLLSLKRESDGIRRGSLYTFISSKRVLETISIIYCVNSV